MSNKRQDVTDVLHLGDDLIQQILRDSHCNVFGLCGSVLTCLSYGLRNDASCHVVCEVKTASGICIDLRLGRCSAALYAVSSDRIKLTLRSCASLAVIIEACKLILDASQLVFCLSELLVEASDLVSCLCCVYLRSDRCDVLFCPLLEGKQKLSHSSFSFL